MKYFDNILSIYQYGFRKGYNSQDFPIRMIEKCRKSVDKGCAFGALSKALACLPHELLIAKLHPYDFDMKSVNLIYD